MPNLIHLSWNKLLLIMHIIFPLCLQLFKVGCFKNLLIKIKTYINHFYGGSIQDSHGISNNKIFYQSGICALRTFCEGILLRLFLFNSFFLFYLVLLKSRFQLGFSLWVKSLIKIKTYLNHFCGGFVLDLYGINKTLFYISPGYTCSSMLFTKAFSFLFLTKKTTCFICLVSLKLRF